MKKPKRYHPLLVSLHWLVAILALLNLLIGLVFFRSQTIQIPIGVHMLIGLLLLLLIVTRFVVRLITHRPEPATTGSKTLDVIGVLVHYGLYFFLTLITVIGLLMSLQNGVFQFTFLNGLGLGNSTLSGIPGSILGISLRMIHRISAYALAGLVSLHVLAAIYHQFLIRDKLLTRMWYGER
jgi:cytochrome b561